MFRKHCDMLVAFAQGGKKAKSVEDKVAQPAV